MIIEKHSVVRLKYNLSDSSGTLIDSSESNGSLIYIQGVNMMMPGIENVVEGQSRGFTFSGDIEPENGYGEYNPEAVIPVPKAQFDHLLDKMEEGKYYNFDTGGGRMQLLKVVSIDDEFVTIDSNHPYAGETLKLECEVEGVRPASEEELASLNSGCGCSSKSGGGCCSSGGEKEHSCGCSSGGDKKDKCCSSGGKKSSGGCGCSH